MKIRYILFNLGFVITFSVYAMEDLDELLAGLNKEKLERKAEEKKAQEEAEQAAKKIPEEKNIPAGKIESSQEEGLADLEKLEEEAKERKPALTKEEEAALATKLKEEKENLEEQERQAAQAQIQAAKDAQRRKNEQLGEQKKLQAAQEREQNRLKMHQETMDFSKIIANEQTANQAKNQLQVIDQSLSKLKDINQIPEIQAQLNKLNQYLTAYDAQISDTIKKLNNLSSVLDPKKHEAQINAAKSQIAELNKVSKDINDQLKSVDQERNKVVATERELAKKAPSVQPMPALSADATQVTKNEQERVKANATQIATQAEKRESALNNTINRLAENSDIKKLGAKGQEGVQQLGKIAQQLNKDQTAIDSLKAEAKDFNQLNADLRSGNPARAANAQARLQGNRQLAANAADAGASLRAREQRLNLQIRRDTENGSRIMMHYPEVKEVIKVNPLLIAGIVGIVGVVAVVGIVAVGIGGSKSKASATATSSVIQQPAPMQPSSQSTIPIQRPPISIK